MVKFHGTIPYQRDLLQLSQKLWMISIATFRKCFKSHTHKKIQYIICLLYVELLVPNHAGGWSEEVYACFLNSYMVYL
jgi:hypothetical protein